MTLAALIQKRDAVNLATAIPAISATQQGEATGTIARIATIAVANPRKAKPVYMQRIINLLSPIGWHITRDRPSRLRAEPGWFIPPTWVAVVALAITIRQEGDE